jgi:hypothetical protein
VLAHGGLRDGGGDRFDSGIHGESGFESRPAPRIISARLPLTRRNPAPICNFALQFWRIFLAS